MKFIIPIIMCISLLGCVRPTPSANQAEKQAVARQQDQYAKAQPVPGYNYSLERDLLIQLYNIRNQQVATHTVWRSRDGKIEYDCPSMGYGLPYDTSLTNPLMGEWIKGIAEHEAVVVGQAEPNGIFASTNTSATWVMCIGPSGAIEPHYVETLVTTYPYPVKVDYDTNTVTRAGKASVTIHPNE
jgi:hypothetical protein